VSEGNAEQPSAQTHARQAVQENPERPAPRDPSTGNGSQSQRPVPQERPIDERSRFQAQRPQEQRPEEQKAVAPGNGPVGQPSSEEQPNPNGQKKDDRGEQLASAPQAAQPGAADPGNTGGRQSPWTAAHVQRTASRNPAGLSSTPPAQPQPEQAQPGQAQPGQVQPGQAQPGQGRPGQAQAGQPSSSQQRPQPQPGAQASNVTPPQPQPQLQPQARTSPAPIERPSPSERPAQSAVPVWDPPPPPQPKQSLLARLGIAKKGAQPEGDSPASSGVQGPAATSAPAQTPPPATAAAATGGSTPMSTAAPQAPTPPQQRPGVQPGPQAPAGQPTGQSHGRTDDSTGRTPPIPGGARPAQVVAPGPQARMPAGPVDPATRMPSAPTHPGAPGPFPVPAPVQALRDSATQTGGLAVPAVAPGAVHAPGTPEAHHPAKPKVGVARRTRKARLRLSRLDPWSVMKTSFLFSIAAGIMLVVAVYSIWTVLSTSGLFESINEIVRSVVSTPGDTTPFRIEEYINTQKVMGVTALIACVDVVIFTALATLGSFLYNLAATMLGGLEITLAED
jgi:Transmembrane domain of unknown function (DUF3566)